MTHERYAKFLAIMDSYDKNNEINESPAYPFVPVFGSGGISACRFLIIGQATTGWDEDVHGTFEGSAYEAEKVLINPSGTFWQFARKFVCGALDKMGQEYNVNELYKNLGYSNLAKIGKAPPYGRGSKNPSSYLLEAQAELCVEQLRFEVSEYKPNIILIASGNYADKKILYPALGADWPQSKETEHVQFTRLEKYNSNGVPAIWVNHPRNLAGKGITHTDILDVITKIASETV
jgi:hypothetical protein